MDWVQENGVQAQYIIEVGDCIYMISIYHHSLHDHPEHKCIVEVSQLKYYDSQSGLIESFWKKDLLIQEPFDWFRSHLIEVITEALI